MNQKFWNPSSNMRPYSKNSALNKGSKSPRWQEEEHRGKEDLSPLLQLIVDNQLFSQNPELDKIFGFYQMSLEQKLEKISKFLLNFKREDRQQEAKLSTICALLASKGVEIDSSELGIQLLSGKPIFINHFLDTTNQKNINLQIHKILSAIHYKDEEKIEKATQKILPQVNTQYTSIYDNLMLYLTEQGRMVYVHKNGFFPALAPFCYPSSVQVTRGALHIMEWGNNLFLVDLNRKNLSNLRRIYEKQINVLLISQVNWSYKLSCSFGKQSFLPLECSLDNNIQKTARMVLQKKVETKFQQLLKQQMPSPQRQGIIQEVDLSASKVQQLSLDPSLYDLMKMELKDPNQLSQIQIQKVQQFINRNINAAYRNEQWRFLWVYPDTLALMMGNYIIGIVNRDTIEIPMLNGNIIGSSHCITCGLYAIQGVHQCQVQLTLRKE